MVIRRDVLRALLCAGVPCGVRGADNGGYAGAPLTAWWQGSPAREDFHVGTTQGNAVSLPARPHEVLRDGGGAGIAYAVSRRPGEWLWKVDIETGVVVRSMALDDSRRFEGHGLLWGIGATPHRALLTTQSDTDAGRGIVGVHDDADLQVVGEWQTGGLGPHQICYWPAAGKLIVANGGLLALPETGRADRSQGPLRSSLAAIEPANGQLERVWDPPLAGVSLRHLAVSDDGVLGVAMQQLPEPEGGGDSPVLALLRTPQSRLEIATAGDSRVARWKGYAGSISARGSYFAVTCPRAGLVAIWKSNGSLTAELAIPGAWGIAAHQSGWWVTNPSGDLYSIDADQYETSLVRSDHGRHWDNHMAL